LRLQAFVFVVYRHFDGYVAVRAGFLHAGVGIGGLEYLQLFKVRLAGERLAGDVDVQVLAVAVGVAEADHAGVLARFDGKLGRGRQVYALVAAQLKWLLFVGNTGFKNV